MKRSEEEEFEGKRGGERSRQWRENGGRNAREEKKEVKESERKNRTGEGEAEEG
jgi:hypothetical protein